MTSVQRRFKHHLSHMNWTPTRSPEVSLVDQLRSQQFVVTECIDIDPRSV